MTVNQRSCKAKLPHTGETQVLDHQVETRLGKAKQGNAVTQDLRSRGMSTAPVSEPTNLSAQARNMADVSLGGPSLAKPAYIRGTTMP